MSQHQFGLHYLSNQAFEEHKRMFASNINPQESVQNNTKDSGLGTTHGTISSNSSSNHTSPESEVTDHVIKHAIRIQTTSTPSQNRPLPEFHHEPQGDISLAFLEQDSVINHTLTKPAGSRRRQRRMHACEYCEKQFDRPSLLKRHTLTHTGERPFTCKFCGKGFSTRSGVNTHERTHTGQRPYVCRICGRRFAAGSNLIFHKYTHTNNRRHACRLCPKAFLTPGDLKKHEYIHTGEWPFKCSICERGFATERNLQAHVNTHSGKKPFKCPTCSKSYAQESSLKIHSRLHLPKQIAEENHTKEKLFHDNNYQEQNSPVNKVPFPNQSFLIKNLLDELNDSKPATTTPSTKSCYPPRQQQANTHFSNGNSISLNETQCNARGSFQSPWMYSQCKKFYDDCLQQITNQFLRPNQIEEHMSYPDVISQKPNHLSNLSVGEMQSSALDFSSKTHSTL